MGGWAWSSVKTTRPDWVRDGTIRVLLQFGELGPQVVERDESHEGAAAGDPALGLEHLPRTTSTRLETAHGEHRPGPAGDVEDTEWVWLLHDDSRPAPDALERLLEVAATNPYAWSPTAASADELASTADGNRLTQPAPTREFLKRQQTLAAAAAWAALPAAARRRRRGPCPARPACRSPPWDFAWRPRA